MSRPRAISIILQLLTKLSSPVHHILTHKLSCNYLSNSVWDFETSVHFSSPISPCSLRPQKQSTFDERCRLYPFDKLWTCCFRCLIKMHKRSPVALNCFDVHFVLSGLSKGNFPGWQSFETRIENTNWTKRLPNYPSELLRNHSRWPLKAFHYHFGH